MSITWSRWENITIEKMKQEKLPFYATFELTPFCNFRCNMCYIRLNQIQASKQGAMLTTKKWIDIGKETARLGTMVIELTGGEVFTRPDFFDIYHAFKSLGFLIVLRTNGYCLDDEKVNILKENMPQRIGITLYGGNDGTYEKICGIRNGFSIVTKNIDRVLDSGINTQVTMTVTKENLEDRELVYQWAQKRNINVTMYEGMINPIRGASRDISSLKVRPSDEECNITEDMKFKTYSLKESIDRTNPFARCKLFNIHYAISWDGHMTMCNTFSSIWEDINCKSITHAYEDLYNKLHNLKRPSECLNCRYFDFCLGCPARFDSDAGSPEKTDNEICRIAQYRYKQALLIDDEC